MIQDLALDLEQLVEETAGLRIGNPQDWITLRQAEQRLRRETKGQDYDITTEGCGTCTDSGGNCC